MCRNLGAPKVFNMIVPTHHPYLPDLTLCDFFHFPKMKFKLRGCRFDTVEEIQSSSQRVLGTLKERDSRECLKRGRNTVSAVSLHKGEEQFLLFMQSQNFLIAPLNSQPPYLMHYPFATGHCSSCVLCIRLFPCLWDNPYWSISTHTVTSSVLLLK